MYITSNMCIYIYIYIHATAKSSVSSGPGDFMRSGGNQEAPRFSNVSGSVYLRVIWLETDYLDSLEGFQNENMISNDEKAKGQD